MDEPLYERAIELLDKCVAELDLVGLTVPIPEDLLVAWEERAALAGTLKEVAAEERTRLVAVYRALRAEAERYEDDELEIQLPDHRKDLVDAVYDLFEQDRRARLLSA